MKNLWQKYKSKNKKDTMKKSVTKKLRGQSCAKCQELKRSQYMFFYKKKRLARRKPTDDNEIKMRKENDNSQKLKMSISTNTV